jgi:hypothetical protein
MLVFVAQCCGCAAPEDQASPGYTIEFRVLTSYGESLPFTVETLVDPYFHKDFATHCRQSTCEGIPKGVYEYSLMLSVNGRRLRDRVAILSERKFLVLDAGPSAGDAGDTGHVATEVRVLYTGQGKRLWVNVRSMYGASSQQIKVDGAGRFTINGTLRGKFLISVFEDDRYVTTQAVEFPARSPIQIDLRKPLP